MLMRLIEMKIKEERQPSTTSLQRFIREGNELTHFLFSNLCSFLVSNLHEHSILLKANLTRVIFARISLDNM